MDLGEAFAQLSDLLLVAFKLLTIHLSLAASTVSLLASSLGLLASGVEFFPEFAPDSFELREELISLDLLPFEAVDRYGRRLSAVPQCVRPAD